MANPKKPMIEPDEHESFKDMSHPIGGKDDGTLDIFPLSELAARIEQRDREEAAWDAAMAEDVDEDELAAMLEEPPETGGGESE